MSMPLLRAGYLRDFRRSAGPTRRSVSPSHSTSCGQMRCQSLRSSLSDTAPPVARTMATHRSGEVPLLSLAIWERREGEIPSARASAAPLPRADLMYWVSVMVVNLADPKNYCKSFLKADVYSGLNMRDLRKSRLALLINERYKGVRGDLIKESGLSAGRITQLLDAKEPFGERAARELERKLDLPERWFDQSLSNTEPAPRPKGGVPLISWIQAGRWNETSDPLQPGGAEAWVPTMKPHGGRAFALRVRGDSMTAPHGKSYPEGCIIIVEPDRRTPSNGERIIATLSASNEVTFKVYKEEDGRRWLQPLNPTHEPIREPFKVVGTVVEKWEEE